MGDRWPVAVAAAAWTALAAVTFVQGATTTTNDFLDNPVWGLGAAGIAALTWAFFVHGGSVLRLHVAFATLVYALWRGWEYAVEGTYAPTAIWLIVASLTLVAYRSSMRGEGTGGP